MLVSYLPGIDRDHLRQTLQTHYDRAFNLRGGGHGTAFDRLLAYVDWAQNAASALRLLISRADIERLVLTSGYRTLLAGIPGLAGADSAPIVNRILQVEVDQRIADFEKTLTELDAQLKRWALPAVYMVPDTSFFIEHDRKIEDWDLAQVLNVREDPIHVLVLMVVIDELDGLKRSKDDRTRWRARHSLAIIDRTLRDAGQLQSADFSTVVDGSGGIPRGPITLEILADPPGHIRLPINDDEIIDRTNATRALTSGPITLVTYDTGQSTRARLAGLPVIKLDIPAGDEPSTPRTGRRTRPTAS
jgi:rRNA-processing protein FCF1